MIRKLLHKKAGPAPCDAEEFIRLARLLAESGSDLEDAFVEDELRAHCQASLDRLQDAAIEQALARLKDEAGSAYDDLLALAEEASQARVDETGAHLLILIPVFAWSRYTLPFGHLATYAMRKLGAAYLKRYTTGARIAVGNCLLSAEHIPERLTHVRRLLNGLVAEMKPGEDVAVVDVRSLLTSNPPNDFSDSRYIVAAISADAPEGLFYARGSTYIERARALMDFALEAHDILETELIGSVFEIQAPNAFYAAWRQTETAMRVFAVRSLVDFAGCMGVEPARAVATAGIFRRQGAEEGDPQDGDYEVRISIGSADDPEAVCAGVVWSCLSEEPESTQGFAADVLAACGVQRIVTPDQEFPMEWCEDCGAPLYATPSGNIAHVEEPSEANAQSVPPTLN
ncbi:MAG: DUF2863 family protein [Duodenibacillus sp.]|nr:DUF2863 family protein [Duodenibacillus sp.]